MMPKTVKGMLSLVATTQIYIYIFLIGNRRTIINKKNMNITRCS